jgi:hypothetical protein
MSYKKIYIAKRNHIVCASGTSILQVIQGIVHKMMVGEGKDLPSYPTFARSLRKYQRLSFTTKLGSYWEVEELMNERYKRKVV